MKTYDTLADFAASLGADGLDVRGAAAHPFEELHPDPMVSEPFRTGYFTLVLVRTGQGRFWLDGMEYDTRPRTVYFTNPGHVKAFAVDEPVTGFVVAFTEAFLKENGRADVAADLPFLFAESAPPFYADRATFNALDGLAAQIVAEARRPSAVQARLVATLLIALLLRFREAFWDTYDPVAEGSRGSAIVGAFRQELEAHVRALVSGDAAAPPSLDDLAGAVGLHPHYLSSVITAKTGRTVREWTTEKLLAEARGLLRGPRLTVAETAYRLGFSEPTAFSRFFKRETGFTPSAYRRREPVDSSSNTTAGKVKDGS